MEPMYQPARSVRDKISAKEYDCKVEYPRRADFYEDETFTSDRGNTRVEKVFNNDAYKVAMSAYRESASKIAEQFMTDALTECNLIDHAKASKAFSMAYDRGHSSGFECILCELEDLAELLLLN